MKRAVFVFVLMFLVMGVLVHTSSVLADEGSNDDSSSNSNSSTNYTVRTEVNLNDVGFRPCKE